MHLFFVNMKCIFLFPQLLVLHLKRDGITHKSWPISPESAAMSPDAEPADARLAFKSNLLTWEIYLLTVQLILICAHEEQIMMV